MFYGKNVGVVPLTDAAGITKVFNWPSHKGLDIGWYATQYCPVLAWQDGFVVDKGYGSEVGNYIVVEHTYSDGKRWTGYIHLVDTPSVKVGDKVTLGKQMGNARRGNSGKSNGVHLHIYLTQIVPIKTLYTWNTMLENCIDPKPYLYWSKEFNTAFISTAWTKELKQIVYPQPVERNIKVHQVEVKSDTRRLRATPSLSGQAYDEYCIKGFYNVLDMTFVDEYTWAKIASIDGNNFWVAVMSGEDLPAKVYTYPKPVERNEAVPQVEIKSDTRKLRAEPSLNGQAYDEMCTRGIYNVQKWDTADGYDWALIDVINGDYFWVAVMEGEDLPVVIDYEKLYNEEKAKNATLTAQLSQLTEQVTKLTAQVAQLSESLDVTNKELLSLKDANTALKADVAKLTTKLSVVEAERDTAVMERDKAVAANKINEEKLKKIREIIG